MWARVLELILAVWLLYSHEPLPCIFIAIFSLLSFYYPLRKMHLLNLGVAFWLWASGYTNFPELASPSQENSVVVGLLLLMLAIVPSHSHLSPHSWQK